MVPDADVIPTGGPPKVVGSKTKTVTRPTNKRPRYLIDEARLPENEKQSFDPKKHLDFQPPKKIYTMKEIGLEGHGISPNAVSDPFSLFTEEAVRQMRAEIYSEASLKNCQYSSTFAKNMIRGMGPAYGGRREGVEDRDSHDSRFFKNVRLSQSSGTAVVMQGRYIEHRALKAVGGRERITMITSFRPKSPFMKDESILTGIRGIGPLTEIYSQYTQYRLEILEERIRARLKKEQRREIAKRPFDVPDIRAFLTEQKEVLEAMLEELYYVSRNLLLFILCHDSTMSSLLKMRPVARV